MNSMKDREKAFETQYALDEEQKFRAIVRRNKIVGRWAAGLLGRDEETYAREVVEADFVEAGEEDVFRKIRADFDAAGIPVSDEDIRQRMLTALQDSILAIKS